MKKDLKEYWIIGALIGAIVALVASTFILLPICIFSVVQIEDQLPLGEGQYVTICFAFLPLAAFSLSYLPGMVTQGLITIVGALSGVLLWNLFSKIKAKENNKKINKFKKKTAKILISFAVILLLLAYFFPRIIFKIIFKY